jgi:hypothetical protein
MRRRLQSNFPNSPPFTTMRSWRNVDKTAAGHVEIVEMKHVVGTILPNEADDYVGYGPARCFSGRPRGTAEQSGVSEGRHLRLGSASSFGSVEVPLTSWACRWTPHYPCL